MACPHRDTEIHNRTSGLLQEQSQVSFLGQVGILQLKDGVGAKSPMGLLGWSEQGW